MTISRFIFRIIRNVSNKSYREKQNTHFMFSDFFRISWRLWNNIEKYGVAREATKDNRTLRKGIACWISKATRAHAHVHAHALGAFLRTHAHTHTHVKKYVILITFPWQEWLHEMAWMLRYRYTVLFTHIKCSCITDFGGRKPGCITRYFYINTTLNTEYLHITSTSITTSTSSYIRTHAHMCRSLKTLIMCAKVRKIRRCSH
jgi:hypothetical protein